MLAKILQDDNNNDDVVMVVLVLVADVDKSKSWDVFGSIFDLLHTKLIIQPVYMSFQGGICSHPIFVEIESDTGEDEKEYATWVIPINTPTSTRISY